MTSYQMVYKDLSSHATFPYFICLRNILILQSALKIPSYLPHFCLRRILMLQSTTTSPKLNFLLRIGIWIIHIIRCSYFCMWSDADWSIGQLSWKGFYSSPSVKSPARQWKYQHNLVPKTRCMLPAYCDKRSKILRAMSSGWLDLTFGNKYLWFLSTEVSSCHNSGI